MNKKLIDIAGKNKPTTPQYQSQREGDIIHSLGSIKRIQNYINWSPLITMEEGIERLVANSLGKE
jgi:nucleoside-diphosphate-sugar epimerase